MEADRRKSKIERMLSWADRRHIISVRSSVLAATVWMTWEVTRWAFAYAQASAPASIDDAAVIAAVTAPFCALQAAVFGRYMSAKDGAP